MLILQAIRKGFLSIYSKYAYWWNNNKSIFFILFIYAWYWDVALFVPWVMITRSWPFFPAGYLGTPVGSTERVGETDHTHSYTMDKVCERNAWMQKGYPWFLPNCWHTLILSLSHRFNFDKQFVWLSLPRMIVFRQKLWDFIFPQRPAAANQWGRVLPYPPTINSKET